MRICKCVEVLVSLILVKTEIHENCIWISIFKIYVPYSTTSVNTKNNIKLLRKLTDTWLIVGTFFISERYLLFHIHLHVPIIVFNWWSIINDVGGAIEHLDWIETFCPAEFPSRECVE